MNEELVEALAKALAKLDWGVDRWENEPQSFRDYYLLRAHAFAVIAEPLFRADENDAYELGKVDGYSEAIADVDRRTGGDGEYFASTIPGRGCEDPETMMAGIVARFEGERTRVEGEIVAWFRAEDGDLAQHLANRIAAGDYRKGEA